MIRHQGTAKHRPFPAQAGIQVRSSRDALNLDRRLRGERTAAYTESFRCTAGSPLRPKEVPNGTRGKDN